ncbi:MarR family winged helix-turn-helix transcriptional regulator [Chitinophaga sp. GCM10012297]|uniref:MarR family transcriptional regulator n=1 Tax=Chitinophaga chungangae TaxID=2821488 RepID=A0ABS3YC85_9BACT|nr:MarR family transcriptional regulator [Chitinophaga chungangae]MBO9152280.1 MarR family transcriptional regulator [Chitinophaga chungangae]
MAHSTEQAEQFRAASRRYSDASVLMHEAIARKAGLSGTDHKHLGLIMQHGELTAGDLARLTGLTTGAVTGLIDRLEQKKLVKRQYVENDRRKVIIVPETKNALKLLSPLFTSLSAKTAELMETFSAKELAAIHRYFTEAAKVMAEVTGELNEDQ